MIYIIFVFVRIFLIWLSRYDKVYVNWNKIGEGGGGDFRFLKIFFCFKGGLKLCKMSGIFFDICMWYREEVFVYILYIVDR